MAEDARPERGTRDPDRYFCINERRNMDKAGALDCVERHHAVLSPDREYGQSLPRHDLIARLEEACAEHKRCRLLAALEDHHGTGGDYTASLAALLAEAAHALTAERAARARVEEERDQLKQRIVSKEVTYQLRQELQEQVISLTEEGQRLRAALEAMAAFVRTIDWNTHGAEQAAFDLLAQTDEALAGKERTGP